MKPPTNVVASGTFVLGGDLPVYRLGFGAMRVKRSPVILPIPGTSSVKHLEENAGAADVQLSDQEFAQMQ